MMGDVRGEFCLVDARRLGQLGLVPEAFYDERVSFPLDPGAVRQLALQLLITGPQVPTAEPGTPLATRDDLDAFAIDTRGDLTESVARQKAGTTWNGLGRGAARVRAAHQLAALLPFSSIPDKLIRWHDQERESEGTFERLAALSLRLVQPPGQEDEWAPPSLDLDSLYDSLGTMLEGGYHDAGRYFRHFGPRSIDLAARFANFNFPDREPLPTLPDRT